VGANHDSIKKERFKNTSKKNKVAGSLKCLHNICMIKNYWLKCLWEAYCGFCIGIVTVFGGLYIISTLINALSN
jgi:hypothetical protein